MIYRIKIEGKEYNENYTFETPKEGDILDELRAIVEDMEEGNIDKLKIERKHKSIKNHPPRRLRGQKGQNNDKTGNAE